MKKIALAVLVASCAVLPMAAQAADTADSSVKVSVSQPLFDANGKRVGNVYRVTADGSAQLIIDEGRLVTVPAATLSEVDGKLTTRLSKKEITARR